MTADEVKKEIAEGRIKGISLDTSIIDAQQRNLEHALLKRMEQFSGSDVTVIFSDVVIQEVVAHLRKDARETQASAIKALKAIGQAWQLTNEQRDGVIAEIFGKETVETISDKRLNGFLERVDATIAKAEDHVAVGELV